MSKLIRFFKKRRNGGFTMVEMIVSVVLLAILLGGMTLMITPILRSFSDTKRDLVAENVSTCIQTYISTSMQDATNVVIFANTNYDSIKTAANDKINGLKSFCKTQTSDAKNAYTLQCISLKYDTTDNRYYLYNEESDLNDSVNPLKGTSNLAFSECLYNDLYYSLSIYKALDLDKNDGTRMNDTAEITISTYSDVAMSNLVFGGIGLTEFREIGRDIALRASNAKNTLDPFKFEIYTGETITACDGFSTTDAVDGARDIYIFFTKYNYESIK